MLSPSVFLFMSSCGGRCIFFFLFFFSGLGWRVWSPHSCCHCCWGIQVCLLPSFFLLKGCSTYKNNETLCGFDRNILGWTWSWLIVSARVMLKYLSFLTRVAAFVVFVIHWLKVLVDQPSWSPARWTWPVENMQMSLRQLSSRCFQLEQPAAWPTWSRSLWTRLKSDFRWGSPSEQTILSTQTQPLRGLLLLRSFVLLLRYNTKVYMTSWEETP